MFPYWLCAVRSKQVYIYIYMFPYWNCHMNPHEDSSTCGLHGECANDWNGSSSAFSSNASILGNDIWVELCGCSTPSVSSCFDVDWSIWSSLSSVKASSENSWQRLQDILGLPASIWIQHGLYKLVYCIHLYTDLSCLDSLPTLVTSSQLRHPTYPGTLSLSLPPSPSPRVQSQTEGEGYLALILVIFSSIAKATFQQFPGTQEGDP